MSEPRAKEPAPSGADPDRFPALEKLSQRQRGRVPYVQATQMADCGAASLAMVLRHNGRHVTLDEVREVLGAEGGVDALSIMQAAEWFGLRGRAVRAEIEALEYLPPAAILHWEFNHFVVLERVSRRGVYIVDPAGGRRFVSMDKFRRSFTGVALILEPSDTFTRADPDRGRLRWYLGQIFRQRGVLGRVLVTSILLRLFALALPLLTALVVDRVVPRDDYHLLAVVGAGLGAIVLFQFLSALIRSHLLLQLRTNLDTGLTLGFVDYLAELPYGFFQRRSAGDLMMRVNSNAQIREILTSNTLSIILDGVLVVLYLALMIALSPSMGALVLVLGAVQVAIFLLARRRYRELMAENLEVQARAQSYLVQMIAGMETLKSAGAEHRAVEHWSNLFVDDLNVGLRRGRLQALVDSAVVALQTGSPLLILAYGAILVMQGDMSLGSMLALNAIAIGFLAPLSALVTAGLQLQLLSGYVERIDDVLRAEPEQERGQVKRTPRSSGSVELDQVSFRYGPGSPLVVRDVSVSVAPGARVAIVGRSGSGKSTLAALLCGLHRPTDGHIRFDGADIRDLDLRSLRRQMGIVTQQPYLFGASVRSNIALADPRLPLERIIEAARLACVHDDIVALPMGYETILADGGASLSGGQRQRIALARALAQRPSILLLDEATSALDADTEARVVRNLERLACTRIVIAHRLSTIRTADLIVVMEDGRIVEQGSHAELLARGGVYAGLIAAQASDLRGPT